MFLPNCVLVAELLSNLLLLAVLPLNGVDKTHLSPYRTARQRGLQWCMVNCGLWCVPDTHLPGTLAYCVLAWCVLDLPRNEILSGLQVDGW